MNKVAAWIVLAVLIVVPSASQAGRFAVVYADTIDLTLLEIANGINVLDYSWALVVNTGETNITSEEWSAAPNQYGDSDDCLAITGLTSTDPTPILPGEAIGRIINHRNGLLLEGLAESEELRPGFFQQFMSLQMFKEAGADCAGQLQYEMDWDLAGESVLLDIVVNLEIGTPDIEFVSYKRVESSPELSTRSESTMGSIKALYR